MSRNGMVCMTGLALLQAVGVVGGVILVIIACSKVILAAGKLIAGLETLTSFCTRLERKFDNHQTENTRVNNDFRECFSGLDSRVGVLEYAAGLADRRQAARRTYDQIARDVRGIMDTQNGDKP